MIKIRLQRKGRIRRPIYHIVVADSRSPRDGRIIEQVGRYDGVTEKKETVLNEDRIMYWLDTGAQPTDSVRKILRQEGLLYKRHLVMWGKSEEEIDAALAEWKAYRDSKKETEVTRKEQVQASLAAEEKAVKEKVAKKAAQAAAELAEEDATAEAEATEATEEVAAETTEETVAETAEETTDEVVEEAPAEEAVAEEVAEPEAEVVEEPAAEAEEATEEVVEEPAVEAEATEEVVEEAAEEPAAEVEEAEAPAEASTDAQSSNDLSAKEAIDHINNTDLADLAGFVTDAEERKTVLAAWEAKQAG